jgi:hypothetical protein
MSCETSKILHMLSVTSDPRYPIGKYQPEPYSEIRKKEWLGDIKYLPVLLENAVLNLDKAQLDTPYREWGWTIHQLVHHIADSHMNAYCRFRLGLTEESPTICPYDQQAWAELPDVKVLPVNISLTLLHALHIRWYETICDLREEEWGRTLIHPEHQNRFTLWHMLGSYAWHGRHHVAHINSLRMRNQW